MKLKYQNAIELLLCHPDATVAEMLGIRLATLKRWMEIPEFAAELRKRVREQKETAHRLAQQAVVNAAARICNAAGDVDGKGDAKSDAKADVKLMLDVLKASGAFDEKEHDPGEALAEVIRQVQAEEARLESEEH